MVERSIDRQLSEDQKANMELYMVLKETIGSPYEINRMSILEVYHGYMLQKQVAEQRQASLKNT